MPARDLFVVLGLFYPFWADQFGLSLSLSDWPWAADDESSSPPNGPWTWRLNRAILSAGNQWRQPPVTHWISPSLPTKTGTMIVVDTKSIPLIPTDDAPTMSIKRLYELPPAHMHYQPLIQRLPNEILGKIFLDATTLSERHAGIRLATTLTHVCSRWRQLALWTSSLWGNITITFPTSREQMARTVAFLLRSRSHPLDLLLDFRDPEWDWEEDTHPFSWKDMEAVLRLLFTHVKRWRHFELLTDTWAPIFTFLWYSRRITTVPMLQTISLSRCNAYFASKGQRFQPASLKQPIPLFGGVALDGLREVTLSGVHLDWAQSPLQNLTSLELKYHASDVMPTLAQFTDILAACPDLQRLSIIGWGPRLPEGAHGTPISDMLGSGKPHVGKILHMPHLTDFSFGFIDIDYAMELLSLFTFPALRTLSLEDLAASLTPLGMQDATPLLEWLTSHCPAQCPQQATHPPAAPSPLSPSPASIPSSSTGSPQTKRRFFASSISLQRSSICPSTISGATSLRLWPLSGPRPRLVHSHARCSHS
ncbi:hypothetical protein BD779DRAFT_810564 [Infundibulicybe gibba]|nr:hypothetical protein BD779DRAFT_810564 [Infundibulicybe gibba]